MRMNDPLINYKISSSTSQVRKLRSSYGWASYTTCPFYTLSFQASTWVANSLLMLLLNRLARFFPLTKVIVLASYTNHRPTTRIRPYWLSPGNDQWCALTSSRHSIGIACQGLSERIEGCQFSEGLFGLQRCFQSEKFPWYVLIE